jgi:hypothetical protein
MKLMMEAAEDGDAEATTKQLELALLIDEALWMAKVQPLPVFYRCSGSETLNSRLHLLNQRRIIPINP